MIHYEYFKILKLAKYLNKLFKIQLINISIFEITSLQDPKVANKIHKCSETVHTIYILNE